MKTLLEDLNKKGATLHQKRDYAKVELQELAMNCVASSMVHSTKAKLRKEEDLV